MRIFYKYRNYFDYSYHYLNFDVFLLEKVLTRRRYRDLNHNYFNLKIVVCNQKLSTLCITENII